MDPAPLTAAGFVPKSEGSTCSGEPISPPTILFDHQESSDSSRTRSTSVTEYQPSPTSIGSISGAYHSCDDLDSITHSPKRKRLDSPQVSDVNEPYAIVNFSDLQAQLSTLEVPYGVLWEVARLISVDKLSYSDVTLAKLVELTGSNASAAPKTVGTFCPDTNFETRKELAFSPERAARSAWEELDREEQALEINPFAGLGNSDEFPGWYGGKVIFKGKLSTDTIGQYKICLERCHSGASCRFARRFGSKYILRIKIPTTILHKKWNNLEKFFKRPFVLWGNIFRSFYAKDDTVFLFRTNEVLKNGQIFTDCPGFSLLEFIEWHNPMSTNQNQTMTKWAARTALGLSNSFPGPVLQPENIIEVEDIVSAQDSDMTDGCGYSNRVLHRHIRQMLGLDISPTCFQYRLGGVKGMSVEDPELDSDEFEKIWVRPSQIKIRYSSAVSGPCDPTSQTVELIRTSHMRTPARLSAESIINLSENGVPSSAFVELLRSQISELVRVFTTWEGPNALYNLWINVEQAGAVLFSRRARELAGETRIRGYGERVEEDSDTDEDDEPFDKHLGESSSAWWVDQISGCPSTLEETVMTLLDSGFTPEECPVLRSKLKAVASTKIKSVTSNFRFKVMHSATAFVIPDHYGVLGENEIQVKSSSRSLLGLDGELTDTIVGEVLLTRNPCKLPTDVRKLRAVEHPRLRSFTDVILCSIRGPRRLVDFLAGGDYDGDKVTVFWDPLLVHSFINSDEKFATEPVGLGLSFCPSGDNEKVHQFINRSESWTPSAKILVMQRYLLGALRDPSIVGKYSSMHDNAMYSLGYSNPRTIKLAYKFCKVLDGSKTGLKIRPDTLREDERAYNSTLGPAWKKPKDKTKKVSNFTNWTYLKRGSNSFIHGEFIMDTLTFACDQEETRAMRIMDTKFDLPSTRSQDPQLTRPWYDAQKMASQGLPEIVTCKKMDLDAIASHVENMFEHHRNLVVQNFTQKRIETRQDILRSLSKKFASAPHRADLKTIMDDASISRLRASYAYIYDAKMKSSGWSRFPWNMAMRELCHIKASAVGPHKTVSCGFYERFKLTRRK